MAKAATKPRSRAPVMLGMDRDWAARDALCTLKRAEEIKADPKLMTAVQKMAEQEKAMLAKVARVKSK